MLDWSQCTAVERTPGKGGGDWVFKGTRVPVRPIIRLHADRVADAVKALHRGDFVELVFG